MGPNSPEVISIGDKEIGTELPQLKFYSRADDIIDMGSFVRLTERDIWKTIEATKINYQDWVARKESIDGLIKLHIYIELKQNSENAVENFRYALNKQFSQKIGDFKDLEDMLLLDPLVVTFLPTGSFDEYMKMKIERGADLAHLKPPHMRPSDEILKDLLTVLDKKAKTLA